MKITVALVAMLGAVLSSSAALAQSPTDAVKGFSIVLVEGSLQPGTSSDLPAPARAAIDDIKDFLPFKSFRLLDASWTVGATGVRSRLRDGNRDYEVTVIAQPQPDAKNLSIKFLLRDGTRSEALQSATADLVRGQLDGSRARLQTEYERLELLRQKYTAGHPDIQAAEQSIAKLREQMRALEQQSLVNNARLASPDALRLSTRADAALVDTSFSMRVGETVVVGTSRVNGDRALIALMTAVSK